MRERDTRELEALRDLAKAFAETCRDLRNTDEINGVVLDTPLTPSLYFEPRGDA